MPRHHKGSLLLVENQYKRSYPSYFKLPVRWLLSFTPVTELPMLLGILSIAAFMKLELFRV